LQPARDARDHPVSGLDHLARDLAIPDLVARHEGRYYLMDYKTSFLGEHASDYAPERLTGHMADHYVLQYHLYLVALHAHLTERLADYDYDRHFGGVYYLYVRGMTGAGDTGVFVDRPPKALVEALSAHLQQPRWEAS